MRWLKLGALAVIGAGLARLSQRSGVTDDEFTGAMPGDDLIGDPAVEWTRAITISKPPAEVWPWLAQMGFGRGGWYTSRLFDRIVWRLDNPSMDTLVEEFLDVEAGDIIPDGPGHAAYFHVAELQPERWIVYRSVRHPYRGHPVDPTDTAETEALEARLVRDGVYLHFSWAWELRPLEMHGTRLLVRTRATYSPAWIRPLEIPLGLVDFYHVSTMFRGIARRVIALPR